jgi:alpha-tubulin suppressor-like RCC1 family protein
MERLDFNTFLSMVIIGEIRGTDLIALCDSCKKLKDFSERTFELEDGSGKIIENKDQYLFRLLLKKANIKVGFGKSPKQTYIEKVIGGRVWGFGSNHCGKLGLGNDKAVPVPTLNPTLKNIIQIISGSGVDCFYLDNEGTVWKSGYIKNVLVYGLSKVICEFVPIVVPVMHKIIQVSISPTHRLLLDDQGYVWNFGYNTYGQLGIDDDITNVEIPILMHDLVGDIIQVATGHFHSLCLDSQGTVWSFGKNDFGQLGLGDIQPRDFQSLIPGLENIVQITAGTNHSLCLDNQGHVWSFGNNNFGQLGLGGNKYIDGSYSNKHPTMIADLENIIQISAGNDHSLCLDTEGKVWSFGGNAIGQLGLKTNVDTSTPTMISNLNNIIQISGGGYYSLCLDNQGRVWGFGSNTGKQLISDDVTSIIEPILIPNLTGVTQISAGGDQSLIIKF